MKTNKKLKGAASAIVLLYLLISFTELTFNFTFWNKDIRFMFSFIVIVITIGYLIITED